MQHWNTNKQSLINYYLQISPEIILINSQGLKSEEFLKIPGYKTYKINTSSSIADGSAIAVKYNIVHKLYDDFDSDVLAIEINTTLGPQLIATTYLPPRRLYVPFPDFYRLLNNNIPTYIIADLNCRHRYFGNKNENTVGKSLVQLIIQGVMLHMGPYFPTYIGHGAATNPDKILANKHHYLNITTEPGSIAISDHIPIVFTLATQPFIIPQPKIDTFHKANWNGFKTLLKTKIQVRDLDACNTNDLEHEVEKWMGTIKEAMNKHIPKREHKFLYQLKITPEIKTLELAYKTLKQNAEINGWTTANSGEYVKIRQELRIKCKEVWRQNWEANIDNIISISRDSKAFWRKNNLSKGKYVIHTNYLKDSERKKKNTTQTKKNVKSWNKHGKIFSESQRRRRSTLM